MRALCTNANIELFERTTNDQTTYGFGSLDTGIPNEICIETTGEPHEIDFLDSVAELLEPEETLIIMEAGHEKLVYVAGGAVAIRSNGERLSIGLNDIYQLAKERFKLSALPSDAEE